MNRNISSESQNSCVPPTAAREVFVEELLQETDPREDAEFENYHENRDDKNLDVYSWEGGYEKTWEQLKESDGQLQQVGLAASNKANGTYTKIDGSQRGIPGYETQEKIRKGVLRNVALLMDMSSSMSETDYKPDRFSYVYSIVCEFVPVFFQLNPLGNLGLMATLRGQSMTLSSLSGNPEEKIKKLEEFRHQYRNGGVPSLVNSLERALSLFYEVPPYGTKELIIIFGSIRTCDSRNIEEIIPQLKERGIKVSVVSIAPELYVLKRISEETKGYYIVALNQEHFRVSLISFKNAPPWDPSLETRLIPMGFPRKIVSNTVSLCFCHGKLSFNGYLCPRCHCKACVIPAKCRCCDLHLVNAADIPITSSQLNPLSPHETCRFPDLNVWKFLHQGCVAGTG